MYGPNFWISFMWIPGLKFLISWWWGFETSQQFRKQLWPGFFVGSVPLLCSVPLLSALLLYQILEFISVYSNLSSCRWFSVPNNYYTLCVFFAWYHKLPPFRLIRHNVFPEEFPLTSTWILKFKVRHPRCVSNKSDYNVYTYIVKHNYVLGGMVFTICKAQLHVSPTNVDHLQVVQWKLINQLYIYPVAF